MNALHLFVLLGCLTPAPPQAPVHTADWPQWRGPNRDGHAADTGLLKEWPTEGPKLLWTFEKAGAGYGSPSIVGDRLFILGAEDDKEGTKEFALCLSVKDCKELWRTPLQAGQGKYLFQWGSGPRSSPTVDGGQVYCLGARGNLVCLECESGKQIWETNLRDTLDGGIPGWGYSESVLIDGDTLLCTPGESRDKEKSKGCIAALDKKTGKVKWRSDFKDGAQYSSIIIATVEGIKHYVTVTNKGLVGFDPETGKLIWRSPIAANKTAVIPTAVFDGKYVFASSGYDSGCGLVELTVKDKMIEAKDLYNNKAMINHHGGVVRVGDYIYGCSGERFWRCLEYKKITDKDTKPVWESEKLDKGSLIYADGHLICYGQAKGTVVLIEASPKGWLEHGRFEIPKKSNLERRMGNIWTHPVVANGKLYLRDHELLFCYDVHGE